MNYAIYVIGIIAIVSGLFAGIVTFRARFLPRNVRFLRGMQAVVTAGLIAFSPLVHNVILSIVLDLFIMVLGVDMFFAFRGIGRKYNHPQR